MMRASKFFGIAVIIYFVGYLLYIIYNAFGFFHINPFIKLKPLSPHQKDFLGENFEIYDRLPQGLKKKCEQRIIWFKSRKKFVFYGEITRKEELKLLLSAAAAFMMLGLKDYRMIGSVQRIIVYPSQYYSKINRRHHLGEYNPGFKSIILSADKIWEGFKIPDDNINLAVHEFAHALSFEMTKKNSWEARRFKVGLRKIKELFQREGYAQKLADSKYFREYGLTNLQEFFSVAVENYFETPSIFHNTFPELFDIIQRMLNFDYEIACIFYPVKRLP